MSEAVWLLTPLKQGGHNFKEAADHGRWVPIGGTLGELGKALEVDEQELQIAQVGARRA